MREISGKALVTVFIGLAGLAPSTWASQCEPDDQTLCLRQTRFEVGVTWTNQRSTPLSSGTGTAVSLSDEAGFFWFFRPGNIELITKVLDGRALTERHWYFHAPLTNVEFLVQVLDHESRFRYRYLNPVSTSNVVQDLAAFEDRPLDGRIMLVVAHPDDEGLFSPLLAELCSSRGQTCQFVVLTRGENGPCMLSGGCGADLGELRSQEMTASAALLGADLSLWQLPDVVGGSPAQTRLAWESTLRSGQLLARLQQEILRFAPEVVLIFDPRHGSTCHPAHRASATLMLDAMAGLLPQPSVYLMTTTADFGQNEATLTASFGEPRKGDSNILSFFGDWGVLGQVMAAHPSQFTEQFIETVQSVPEDQQAVHLVHLSGSPGSLPEDPNYLRCKN